MSIALIQLGLDQLVEVIRDKYNQKYLSQTTSILVFFDFFAYFCYYLSNMELTRNQQFVLELYKDLDNINNIEDFVLSKKRIFGQDRINPPSNAETLKIYNELIDLKVIKPSEKFEHYCKKHKIRTLSGVSVIAILTEEKPCPGNCVFCPTEKDMPKSYLSNEPAVMRAIKCNFDAYAQVKARLNALKLNGHVTSKNEIIIMGGTWSYLEYEYQKQFILGTFMGLNNPEEGFDIKKVKSEDLLKEIEKQQSINESADNRCVGLTLETRPDYITEEELIKMRQFGCTRVEIGVQTVFDDIAELNKRGHSSKETIEATKLLKDAGFKICYHMMPGLPGSNIERDIKMFEELYNNADFKPDMIKVYPCVVVENAEIYNWMKEGKYTPYSDTELIDLLIEVKKITPYWVRINRLIRDIPSTSIVGGNKIPNLREIVLNKMHKQGEKCNCIRCREIRDNDFDIDNIEMFIEEYKASDGIEYFLSFEDKERKNIFSFLRLRIPSQYFSHKKHFINCLNDAAIIRELHTYGEVVSVNQKTKKDDTQHIGFGRRLIQKAEEIIKEKYPEIKKHAVIS